MTTATIFQFLSDNHSLILTEIGWTLKLFALSFSIALVIAVPLATTIKLSFEELEFRTKSASFVGVLVLPLMDAPLNTATRGPSPPRAADTTTSARPSPVRSPAATNTPPVKLGSNASGLVTRAPVLPSMT